MSKEKEVVVTEKMNEIAVFDASLFEADAGKGMEGMGQDDLALPFLKVLSGNDPILDENEEARKGDIYNTVTGEVFKGKDGLRVITRLWNGCADSYLYAFGDEASYCPVERR